MNAVKELLRVAAKIEQKLGKTAQMGTSAMAADVQDALKAAKLWGPPGSAELQAISTAVSPLLNTAGVPNNVSLNIKIVVDKGLNVHFVVDPHPPHPSAITLARLLKNAYAGKMKAALVAAKLTVADTITADWLSY